MTINQLIERLEMAKNVLEKFYQKDDFEIQVQLPLVLGAGDIDFVSVDIAASKADIWIRED